MKYFASVFLFFIACSLYAQTLTQVFNEPQPGDVSKTVALDTSAYTSGMTLTLTGVGSNWDFSLLKTASDDIASSYVAPSTLTNSSNFPGATVAQVDSGMTTFIKSVITPTTRTEVLGFVGPDYAATFTNSAILAVYPISIGSTFTDNIAGSVTFSTNNLACTGLVSYTADGTGTLTLSDGFVYKNVLRVKTVQTLTASVFTFPFATIDRITYEFFDASEKFPVLSLSYQSIALTGNPPDFIGVARGNNKSFTDIKKYGQQRTNFELYPNPATDQLSLKGLEAFTGPLNLTFYDVTGKTVRQINSNGMPADTVDLDQLPEGVYTVELRHSKGVSRSKLVVQ